MDFPPAPMPISRLRENALAIFQAGIIAADPYRAVGNHLTLNQGRLKFDLRPHQADNWSKVHTLAFGKAAVKMAKAVQDFLPERLWSDRSLVVTNYENAIALDRCEVIGAGHPLPDENGLRAAQKLVSLAKSAQKDELLLTLISGGGSALIPCPVASISLADKLEATELLLASGASINQINCVRKHLSQLKGGGLAKFTHAANLHALILSDVLADDISAIASGPTVPDPTTFADAIEILENKAIWRKLPASVQHYLRQGRLGHYPETPKPHDPIFKNTRYTLVGGNAISVQAMRDSSILFGYDVRLYSDKLCGEAKEEAEKLALFAKQFIAAPLTRPTALLAGGETTVTLSGNGLGGRNQELALAFALAAERIDLPGNWTFLSAGTDGRDGPTDAAGAIIEPNSLKRMRDSAIMPEQMLANNDSYHALKISRDLLITGATGTNVADLQILLINPFN